MHWDTYKQDNYSTVGGDGGCRVGEIRAGTTSPMPDHKGFKLQELSEIHPLTPAVQALRWNRGETRMLRTSFWSKPLSIPFCPESAHVPFGIKSQHIVLGRTYSH